MNLIPSPEDLSVDWTNAATTILTNVSISPRGDLTADSIEDGNAGAYEYLIETGPYTSGQDMALSMYVEKDAIPAATRFVGIRFRFTTGVLRTVNIRLDTLTGAFTSDTTTAPMLVGLGVIDAGDYWRVYIIANDEGLGATIWEVYMFPAIGANVDLTTNSTAAVGAAVFWGILLEESSTLNPYFSLGGSKKNGMGLSFGRMGHLG